METKRKRTRVVVSLSALVVFSLMVYAGDLEPSGPPGPTMKTLAEIEPGTPISSVPYTIAESGSYYLCANAQTDEQYVQRDHYMGRQCDFGPEGFFSDR